MNADDVRRRDESGAALIIALIFVIAVALIITALISLTGTNLASTANLQNDRSTEYAVDGVIDGGIQVVRPMTATTTNLTSNCGLGSTTPIFDPTNGLNGFDLVAFCGDVGTPNGERIVTFEACSSTNTSFASCQDNSLLEAVVTFVDEMCSFVSGNPVPSCSSSTGYSVTTNSWTVKRANA